MYYKEVKYVPALYKIIDEIFANSIDEAIRTNFKYANKIKVTFTENTVTVEDNGRGLPQELFEDGEPSGVKAVCELRAGTNFDNETKASGSIGTFGVGSSATNIFSKRFEMYTYNGTHHLYLLCTNNLDTKEWNIEKSTKKCGTIIKFQPDLERFGLDKIDNVYPDLVEQQMLHLSQVFPIEFILDNKIKADVKKETTIIRETVIGDLL